MLASMGWQPGQGLGPTQGGRVAPVLPALRWDKSGLGSSTHVKRLGAQATRFKRAAAAITAAASSAQPAADKQDAAAAAAAEEHPLAAGTEE